MVPYFARRIAMPSWWRTVDANGEQRTRVTANFHKFYGDTALYGNTAALMCGYAYFGAEHILFGTDMPLGGGEDLGGGFFCTQDTISSIEQMDVPVVDKEKIFSNNAKKLFRMEPTR
jgi:predicted TIM-barrel fold metal-dependent hydrolase